MNIKDVKKVNIQGDMLKSIFKRQRQLISKYHPIEKKKGIYCPIKIPLDLNNCLDQQRLKDMAYRCISEIVEATECLKNKPWKETEILTDIDHYHEELADALHFFVELCILSGLNARGLHEVYHKKAEVNRFRQRSKY